MQRDDINHLNSMQVTSRCTSSRGSENEHAVHSAIKQGISESVQHTSCDDTTDGCHDIDVKREMSPFKPDNSGCGSISESDAKRDSSVSLNSLMEVKNEMNNCSDIVMEVKNEVDDSSYSLGCDIEVKNEMDNSSDSLCCDIEVKIETDANVWCSQESKTQSYGHDDRSDNNHEPNGAASLGLSLSMQREHTLQMHNGCPDEDSKSTECQKRMDGCTYSFCETNDNNLLGTHSVEKTYKCSTCSKQFSQSSQLKAHWRIHNGEEPYKCSICDKVFSYSSQLIAHMRTHTGEKPHTCSICDKAFSHTSTLKNHMRTHTGEKLYKCSRCDKVFSQLSHLGTHERAHTGEKPFTCSTCDKSFSRLSSLNRHERTHTGKTSPYKCFTCSKTFSYSCHLKVHMRIHTGEKPYKCLICDRAFTHSYRLKTHAAICK